MFFLRGRWSSRTTLSEASATTAPPSRIDLLPEALRRSSTSMFVTITDPKYSLDYWHTPEGATVAAKLCTEKPKPLPPTRRNLREIASLLRFLADQLHPAPKPPQKTKKGTRRD